MKNRKIVSIVIISVIIFVLLLVSGGALFKNSTMYYRSDDYLSQVKEERSVGSMQDEKNVADGKSFDFEQFTGKWTVMEITARKGTEIILQDQSEIREGLFYIIVLDSDYNIIIKREESNENTNITFTIPEDGEYRIRIAGKNATGQFNVTVRASEEISLLHKDFFD